MTKFGKLLENLFGWCDHDWTKWKLRGCEKNYIFGQVVEATVQTRSCTKCGHSEIEEVRG